MGSKRPWQPQGARSRGWSIRAEELKKLCLTELIKLKQFLLSLDSPLCQKVRSVVLDVQPSRLVAARRQQSQTQGTSKTHSSGTWPGRFLQQPEIETRKNREFKCT